MRIENITISNYKSIAEMSLAFKDGINLLIGDNGVGKTSVLEAITVALGDFLNGLSGVSKKGITPAEVRMDTEHIADASQGVSYCTPITITSTFHTDAGMLQGEVTRRDETSRSKTRFLGKETAQ